MHSVEGELSWEFFSALKRTLDEQGYSARLEVPDVYLTFVNWWDDNMVWNMTTKAIWKIVTERTGVTWFDVHGDRVAVRGFDSTGMPTCETVRAIAIHGGKWEHEGVVTKIVKP